VSLPSPSPSASRTLEFWFDYSCPYAYLASTQVEAFARRIGAVLSWRPMLLGGVFRAHGTPQNLMNVLSPAKAQHNARDMARWAELFEVPLTIPAGHPLRTVEALRATLATGVDPAVVHGFFRAYWVEGRPPSDPETVRAVLAAAGHDADAVRARAEDPHLKDLLRAHTDEAIGRGIFGAPSYVVDGTALYWGADRMDLIAGGPGPWFTAAARAASGATMAHTLELYWDFSSPFAYLASTQAEALAKRTGATLIWRPMLLGALFRKVGQPDVPLASWPAPKQRYYMEDMKRWAAYWGVPYQFPTRFPMNTVKALRAYLALPEERRGAFREATFRAYWAEDQDINDEGVLRSLLGAEADAVLARTQTPEIKQALIDATQRAVDAGVFGAPAWVIDGMELYWGQDRLPLVERALQR
jgi:2-hydroxychromene-2-carboxylate isomerase